MKSFVNIKEADDKETALSIPHIQSIEKEGEGSIVHYRNPYVNDTVDLYFDLSVDDIIKAIHEAIGQQVKRYEGSKNTCPNCGEPIKIGKGKTGYYFIGCSAYPRCNWCTPIDAWMRAGEDPEKWKMQRKLKRS